MILRSLIFFLLLAVVNPLFAEEETAASPTPRPSLLHRMTHIFHKDKKDDDQGKKKNKGDELTMDISPQPLKLSQSHDIQVTIKLTNNSEKIEQFNFPTTQRIEVLLRNETGKVVTQWSENQSFDNDFGYVTINPHEHVEYTVTISGRDMAAGRSYTVEGFFPNYEKLRISKTIVAER
ncbi:MAG: BsuPI-related putative proteinase inhibitor [Chthoniobacteraceae bacterium]